MCLNEVKSPSCNLVSNFVSHVFIWPNVTSVEWVSQNDEMSWHIPILIPNKNGNCWNDLNFLNLLGGMETCHVADLKGHSGLYRPHPSVSLISLSSSAPPPLPSVIQEDSERYSRSSRIQTVCSPPSACVSSVACSSHTGKKLNECLYCSVQVDGFIMTI